MPRTPLRDWADGTGPERIAHEWTWRDGEVDLDRFAMLCEAAGKLPTDEANRAASAAVREIIGGSGPEQRQKMLDYLFPDPARRTRVEQILRTGSTTP